MAGTLPRPTARGHHRLAPASHASDPDGSARRGAAHAGKIPEDPIPQPASVPGSVPIGRAARADRQSPPLSRNRLGGESHSIRRSHLSVRRLPRDPPLRRRRSPGRPHGGQSPPGIQFADSGSGHPAAARDGAGSHRPRSRLSGSPLPSDSSGPASERVPAPVPRGSSPADRSARCGSSAPPAVPAGRRPDGARLHAAPN